MVRGKKKYQSGEGARYISRTQALKYLQLSLNDFRRLCILKGVYPREPRNRKKAQKGDIGVKTLYHKKDIQFLLHEPIIEKFRELRVLFKKIRRARSIREFSDVQRFRDAFPVVKLDNIVKERYPTFIDALRDLDDCLTLMFLFATFPALRHAPLKITTLCRRLTIEFLHYVMAARALRKVFISIKGYYYQAEIKGQTVTWIVPHHFSYEPQSKHEVDFRVMTTFVEFYTVLLGFVNFRLYHSLNLVYPPTFTEYSTSGTDPSLIEEDSYVQERIATLNVSLGRKGESVEDDATELDEFPLVEDQTKLDELRKEAEQNKKLKTLFKGLKFYINREVPREPVVFIIRCFGGEVSWDKNTFLGATFEESDETITHQIVDRNDLKQQYISRYYVQPQWLFDSVNARELLPIEKYFAGVILPPHLSPFHDEHKLDQYIPPEEMALRDPSLVQKEDETSESDEDEDEEEEEEEDDEDENIEESSPKLKRRKTEIDNSSEEDEEEEEEEEDDDDDEDEDKDEDEGENEKKVEIEKERRQKRKTMAVTAGTVTRENPAAKKDQERQEFKLREKMVRNKYRKLYKSMVQGKRQRAKEAWLLGKKRSLIDAEEKAKRKAEKKNEKISKAQAQKTVSA